jgi:hypothetical protein
MIGTLKALAIGCAMSVAGMAATCTTTTWTFSAGSGGAQCGSENNGVSFTQGGETITILPEYVINGIVQTTPGTNVNGLFEVGKGQNGNLASGIGPYVASQGGNNFTGEQGIQDVDPTRYNPNLYDTMLYIEVNQATIPSGTTLSFVMQEGDVADNFNVYTSTPGSSTTVPNLTSMTEKYSNVSVGTMNGGVSLNSPQFSITTTTTSANPIEFIAIEADCTYLLLNQITAKGPSGVPEPRFYGLMLAGFLGLAGMLYQKRRAAQANA